jgi:hypothetical protein|nr:MAG TPA_asm: Myocyte-specific enhancer factor [Caudoviricetes sp.]
MRELMKPKNHHTNGKISEESKKKLKEMLKK